VLCMSSHKLPARTIRHRSVTIEGVSIPILEGGRESDEAVLFLHGNPGSGRDWEWLAGEVSDIARVIAPDMPGFGQADKPADFDYTVQGYADFLAALIRSLGLRRVHLVLHDFGGPWGLTWAARHRESFASVVLINTGILADYRWHAMARLWRMPIVGEFVQMTTTRLGFHLLLKQGNPKGLPRNFIDRMYDDYDPGTRRAILKLYRSVEDLGAAAHQLANALQPLHRPALVIWGRQDPYISVDYAMRQRDVFTDAEVVILDESGHWPFADDPDGTREVLLPFLRRQVTSTG
jgi:pimeloyl-ACP methyl ester carboxylesterase